MLTSRPILVPCLFMWSTCNKESKFHFPGYAGLVQVIGLFSLRGRKLHSMVWVWGGQESMLAMTKSPALSTIPSTHNVMGQVRARTHVSSPCPSLIHRRQIFVHRGSKFTLFREKQIFLRNTGFSKCTISREQWNVLPPYF